MRVLSIGQPFFRDPGALAHYRGPHDVRTLSATDRADYRFDPLKETWQDVLLRIGQQWEPELALFWFPENDPPPMGVEDSPIPTVAMAGDWNMFHTALATNLGRYDLVLTDKNGTRVLDSKGVRPYHLFPLYSYDSRFHRPYGEEKDIDILYVGSLNFAHYRERAMYLERIAKLSNRYRVALVSGVHDEAYGRLLNRGKIVFNHSIRGEVNLRVFETMSCGSLAFLEDTNCEVRDWFEDGKDLVLYNDDNLEERLVHYLENPDESRAIIERALARVSRFAPENRINELIDWVAAQPSSGRPFRESAPLEQVIQTTIQYVSGVRAEYKPLRTKIVGESARLCVDDPRAWALVAKSVVFPPTKILDEKRVNLALQATRRASELDPHSAPYALNAATVAEWLSRNPEPFLRATLEADSLNGEEHLIGWFSLDIWMRWLYALAIGKTQLSMLHAEAHARLGYIEHMRGHKDTAVEHFARTLDLDPDNTSVTRPLAEAYWELGRREDALRVLELCREHFRFELEVRDRLITWYRECGMNAAANEEIRDAKLLYATLKRSAALSPPVD